MSSDHPLDNPFWSALHSLHAHFALGTDEVRRFPADVAPFLGVEHAGVETDGILDSLVPPGDSVLLMGVAPARLPQGWALEAFDDLAQMACDGEVAVPEGPPIIELGPEHRADALALTALVYPHYFRPRTMELGRYFGIYVEGRLAAMAGERLGAPGFREMSAICTHPDFIGRGYARRLTAMLGNDTLHSGRRPFLHVSQANARAMALYAGIGYRLRRTIPFWSLRRA
jgi:ribosomal protein S18 acetylase RimI-like enzyme